MENNLSARVWSRAGLTAVLLICTRIGDRPRWQVQNLGGTMSDKPRETRWHGIPGAGWKHIDDGDTCVYIKTTWTSLFVIAALLIGLGYWLGS